MLKMSSMAVVSAGVEAECAGLLRIAGELNRAERNDRAAGAACQIDRIDRLNERHHQLETILLILRQAGPLFQQRADGLMAAEGADNGRRSFAKNR